MLCAGFEPERSISWSTNFFVSQMHSSANNCPGNRFLHKNCLAYLACDLCISGYSIFHMSNQK